MRNMSTYYFNNEIVIAANIERTIHRIKPFDHARLHMQCKVTHATVYIIVIDSLGYLDPFEQVKSMAESMDEMEQAARN